MLLVQVQSFPVNYLFMKSIINKAKYKKQYVFCRRVPPKDHFFAFYQANALQKFSYKPFVFKAQYKNTCVLSGRNRSVLRIFKISRIQLRKLMASFSFSGLTLFSWLSCPYGGNGRHGRFKIYFFAGSIPVKGIFLKNALSPNNFECYR